MSAREHASFPGTTKAKLAASTHADHRRREMASKDPEVQLAAELVLQNRRLHEQFPGAPVLAMSQKQAQKKDENWKKTFPKEGEANEKKVKVRTWRWCKHHMA